MLRNAQRQRALPAVQPACLDQQRQTPEVIRVCMCDPNSIKIRKRKAKIQKLRAARLPGIQKHVMSAKLKKDAGLKASRSHIARPGSKESYRWHFDEQVEDLLATDNYGKRKSCIPLLKN